ncbi:patatin-like phospholipase family protein [Lentisphaerota bacterium ZTH]|nr:patatin-like phospholipase family protein [Lentisphaerota bacterium]WET06231.1 patatin-like phospholipase family protein [Lentisphaerota bacterium ZTH]
MDKQKLKPFRVLSLDGGGMRGMYTLALLEGLTKLFNPDFYSTHDHADLGRNFNLICGTSTGSIIAAGLAYGLSCSRIEKIYTDECPKIFTHPRPFSKLGKLFWAMRFLFTPPADANYLRKIMEETFGDITLRELHDKRDIAFMAATTDAVEFRPVIMRTPHREYGQLTADVTLVDALMASAAAPMFFPGYDRHRSDGPGRWFMDGGLWANNPSMFALADALHIASQDQPIEVISVGCCVNLERTQENFKPPRNIPDWVCDPDIMEMVNTSQGFGGAMCTELFADALCKTGRSVRFLRLPELGKHHTELSKIKIDDSRPPAIKKQRDLALSDAEHIYKRVGSEHDNPDWDLLKAAFTNLQPAECE